MAISIYPLYSIICDGEECSHDYYTQEVVGGSLSYLKEELRDGGWKFKRTKYKREECFCPDCVARLNIK